MRHIILLLLAGILASCQPVPHPFEDVDRLPSTPALRPPDSAGIIVLPIVGAPAAASQSLAAAMAEGLRDRDIPASTAVANRGSYRLTGSAAVAPAASGRTLVTIDWTLTTADGTALGHASTRSEAAAQQWQAGDRTLAGALAEAAVASIAKLVEGDAPMPGDVAPVLAVRGVTGAPGDGGEALLRAIDDALRRANIDVAPGREAKSIFTLAGRVEMSPPEGGKQQVRVRWILAAADGRELGQVSQENAVPAGSLDGAWGDIAYAVATAAAPGIADLLAHAKLAEAGG
jgi:hypothetical protein